MKTILVTGGAGYIGSHMAEHLIENGYNVIVLDNLCEGHKEAIPAQCISIIGDFGNKNLLEQIFSQNHIDAIMHFAAYASVPDSVVRPNIYYNNNVSNLITLLDTALTYNVKNFIFSSSAATFGESETGIFNDEHPQKPINPYGYTKLVGEHILQDYHKAFGLNYCAFRYFCAAGGSKSGNIGEAHSPETHVIPVLLDRAIKDETFFIFGDDYNTPDGTCIRDFIHVLDIVEAHRLALEQMLNSSDYAEEFNLGSEKGYSIKDLITTASKILNKEIKYEVKARRPGDPATLIANSNKAFRKLNWTPTHSSLEEILTDALRWRQNRKY